MYNREIPPSGSEFEGLNSAKPHFCLQILTLTAYDSSSHTIMFLLSVLKKEKKCQKMKTSNFKNSQFKLT